MKRKILMSILTSITMYTWAQENPSEETKKKRLDFAKNYFELGGTFFPSFTGKSIVNNEVETFKNSASFNQYLTWGAFHFWGHAELYVTFPLNQTDFKKNDQNSFELKHSVVTGARFFPWVYQEKKIIPYVGVNWGALDFQQKSKPDEDQPFLSKDFMMNYDIGVLYGYRNFSLRLGVNYFPDNKWQYPIDKTNKEEIKTPNFAFQFGLLYSMDTSNDVDKETRDKWNSYPRLSKQTLGSVKFGDFFVGVGPSMSFSLSKSEYNESQFPYLKNKITSKNYFDIAAGYHFYKAGVFTALSFRNPKFETEGYGSKQVIRKTSLALEVNKFLTDYTGFAPYIGLNVAYDKLKYNEMTDNVKQELTFNKVEPGITVGWDVRPGKNDEALILRTNFRWYPFSEFNVDGKKFKFSQLEYNLIQLVFYPEKLIHKKK